MKVSTVKSYGVALACCGVAILGRLTFLPMVGVRGPLILAVLAVVVAAGYGGLAPGLLATVIAGLGSTWLLPQPHRLSQNDLVSLTVFAFIGTVISVLSGRLRDALRQAEENEARHQSIAETVPGLIYSFYLSGPRTGYVPYASPYLFDLCGLAPEDIRTDVTPFFDHIHPHDRDHVWQSIHSAARQGMPWRSEFRLLHPDKGEVWIEAMARPGHAPDDSPRLWYGVMMDITARRHNEAMSREWERAFEQAELAIAMTSVPSETIKGVNEAFARERGYEPEELTGLPAASFYPPEEWPRLAALVRAADQGSGHAVFESVQLRKDGSRFPVLVDQTAVRDKAARIVSRVSIVHDLTGQKRIETESRRTEALYRSISTNLPSTGVFVVDSNLRYLAVAGPLAATIGYPREKLEGRLLSEIVEGSQYEEARERFECALRGESDLAEARFEGRLILSRYVPLRDEGGNVIAAMAICQDITDLRGAEDQIRKLNEDLELRVRDRTVRLEAANQELEAFAYSVSHDLRAPLRGIDGWAEALREDVGEVIGEKGGQFLNRIRSEAQRMALLIDGLLDLSRLTRAEMRWMPVDLSDLANRHALRLAEANPGRKITFLVEPGLSAEGDPRLLEAAIGNLMENAVKFTSPRHEATIEVGRGNGQREMEFYVRDNGVGFEMSHSSRLFAPFQRLHKASEFPGTGIGLATVQRVIRRHGGRVWADARKGEGATFRFTLGSLDRKGLHGRKSDSAD